MPGRVWRKAVEDQMLAPVGADLTSGAIRHARNSDLVQAVANDSFAIGITSHAEV